jgi:hypothetical protein
LRRLFDLLIFVVVVVLLLVLLRGLLQNHRSE